MSLGLEVLEEREHHLCVEVIETEVRDFFVGPACREAERDLECVPIAVNRVRTGATQPSK